MDLKAEMHALLSSIEDEAARLDLRISLAAIEQGATRLRGRIGVLEERAAGAGADAAHVIFNDAGNLDSQEDGDFNDAMEEDWYGQDNVDEPAQVAAEQQQAPEQQAPEQQAPEQAPAGSRAAEQQQAPELREDGDANFDRCGTWGCLLPDRHAGLHSFAAPEGRRPRIPVLPFGGLPRTVPQQPSLAARQAALAAIHRAEHAAEAEAEGRGGGEAEDPDEAEGPAEAEDQVVAEGRTDSTRVSKLRADFAAWLVAIGKNPGVRGGAMKAQKFIKSLDEESPWLSDSRLSLMQTYRESGLTRVQLKPSGRASGSYSKVERFQYLVEQQPDCMDVDRNAVHGQWFWPIDHAWIFGEPDKPQGWTKSLLGIMSHRFSGMMNYDHCRLITGVCANPQPAGRYINYADWISMWNKSKGFCPLCNRDMWIGFDEECNDEDIPPQGQKATIQRLDNSIIHLRNNCHDMLICADCNSDDPTRHDGQHGW